MFIYPSAMPNNALSFDRPGGGMPRQSLYLFKRDGILEAVSTLTAATGKAPSVREIAEIADVSVATLHSYLVKMRNEGAIEWTERHHRSLKVKPLSRWPG